MSEALSLTEHDIRAIATSVAEMLLPLIKQPSHPEWANSRHNPYGSLRAFQDAARRREFKTFRVNRVITAKWTDVTAAIEAAAKRRDPGAPPASEASSINIDDLVERARPRKGGARG